MTATDLERGAQIYNPLLLWSYDVGVLKFSAPYLWGCPLDAIQAQYDRYLSPRHLEIGVGTGYLLDHCRSLTPDHRVTLLDLNINPLRHTRARLRRIATDPCRASALRPLPFRDGVFGSVGLNFVLHCLPGADAKLEALGAIRATLAPGGTLFGSTILASVVERGWLVRGLVAAYNRSGVFSNTQDTAERFTDTLQRHFAHVETRTDGGVLLFAARA